MEGAIYAETIPYEETRDYVKKVMSNSVYYAAQFGDPPRSLKQRLGIVPGKTSDDMTPDNPGSGCQMSREPKIYCVGGAVRDRLLGLAGPGSRLGGGGQHAGSDGGAGIPAGRQGFPGVPASGHA